MAQSPADMQSRFSTLANSTRLTDSALKPWHLKISFNQMSSKVRPADSGVIEEWWVSAEQYRISLISTLYAGTTTRDGQQIARTEGVERLPAVYLDLLELFTNPLPSAERIEKSSVILTQHPVGKTQLDCFVLTARNSEASRIYFGTAPSFCAGPGLPGVNVLYRWQDQVLLIGRQVRFQGKVIPKELDIFTSGAAETHAQLESLSSFDPAPSEFALSSDQTLVEDPVRVGQDSYLPSLKPSKKVPPAYPVSARNAHIAGSVVLDAVIAEDGHVESLSVMHSVSPELSRAAIEAVRQWRYGERLQDGHPVKLETTITVNFSMSP